MASVWDLGHGTQHASMEVIWRQVKKQACWGEAKCPPSVVSPVHCHSRLGYVLQAGISRTGLQRDQGFNALSLAPEQNAEPCKSALSTS